MPGDEREQESPEEDLTAPPGYPGPSDPAG